MLALPVVLGMGRVPHGRGSDGVGEDPDTVREGPPETVDGAALLPDLSHRGRSSVDRHGARDA